MQLSFSNTFEGQSICHTRRTCVQLRRFGPDEDGEQRGEDQGALYNGKRAYRGAALFPFGCCTHYKDSVRARKDGRTQLVTPTGGPKRLRIIGAAALRGTLNPCRPSLCCSATCFALSRQAARGTTRHRPNDQSGSVHLQKARRRKIKGELEPRMSRSVRRPASLYLDPALPGDSYDSRGSDAGSIDLPGTWLSGVLPLPKGKDLCSPFTTTSGPFAADPPGSMNNSFSSSGPSPSFRRQPGGGAFDRLSASTSRKLAALLGSKESIADTETVHSFSTKSSSGSSLSVNNHHRPGFDASQSYKPYKRNSSLPHPYSSASINMGQTMIRDDDEDDETCPVCLEPLSFRLPGEKPHIVPQCGHRLRTHGSLFSSTSRQEKSLTSLCR
jgi:hypothetical protein